jgi:nicotinamidase-related amidase
MPRRPGAGVKVADGCSAVAASALVVTDMLNPYEHEDAEPLMSSVGRALAAMRRLIAGACDVGTTVVYVNDNHGDWSATRTQLCGRALAGAARELVEPILPRDDVAFLTKARHSAFYETSLDYLLRSREIRRVVLVGQVTEQCILYSALDAYVRHYEITVARDAVAHIHEDLAEAALAMVEMNMRGHVTTADELLSRWPDG